MNLELRILDGSQAGRRIRVGSKPVTFGRSAAMDVSFPQDSFMSGTHLSVQEMREGIAISDLRSTNGTFVNGERITQVLAGLGDVIKIGNLTMKIVMAEAPISGKVLSSPLVPQMARPIGGPAGATTMIMTLGATEPPPAAEPVAASNANVQEALLRVLRQTSAPLYCLLDAAADPMLPSLVAVACEDAGKHHLLEGAGVTPKGCSPYLLVLPAESTLLPVLLSKGWGKGWASYFTSDAPYAELYQHFRKFLMVQVGGGGEIYFRFYDPRVLRTFLPAANSTERSMFFGPVRDWLLEGETADSMLSVGNGDEGLRTATIPLSDSSS